MWEKGRRIVFSIVLSYTMFLFVGIVSVSAATKETMTKAFSDSDVLESFTVNDNTESAGDLYSPAWQPTEASTLSIIGGSDDREPVKNSKAFPNSCTGKIIIKWRDGSVGHGTAFMVSANKALTAGHCLYDSKRGGYARSIQIYPGRSLTSSGSIYNPYGSASSEYVVTYDRFTNLGDSNYDCGIIKFSTNIGNKTGWLGMHGNPGISFVNREYRMTGYSGTGSRMMIGRGFVRKSTYYKLFYDCDTVEGTSGAALYKKYTNNGWTAVGIHSIGGTSTNSGTRIHKSLFDEI